MPDPSTLPARLRHLAATDYDHNGGASASDEAAAHTLRAAADELERLCVPPEPFGEWTNLTGALRALAERLAPGSANWQAVALNAAAELDRLRHVDEELGALLERLESEQALAVTAEIHKPTRRFAVVWSEFDGAPPAGGTFVRCGPVDAVWRVHHFDRLVQGGRLAELEPVDPHDVPMTAWVRELPSPVTEVFDDDPASFWETTEDEPSELLLCEHFHFRTVGGRTSCERLHGHEGEHFGHDFVRRSERVWETGDEHDRVDERGPWSVPRDSDQGRRTLEREGVRT